SHDLLLADHRNHVADHVQAKGKGVEMTTTTASPVTTPRRRRPLRSRAYSGFRVIALIVIVLVFVLPLIWMLLSSLKTNVDIYDVGKTLVFTPTFDNFANVLGRDNYFQFIFNSAWIAFASTGLSL